MKFVIRFLPGLLLSATAVAQGGVEDESFFPQQLTAQELLTHCASSYMTDRGRRQQRYCLGFVSGVEEALRLSVSSGSPTSVAMRICVPAGEPARGIADAYIRYAGRHSTDLAKPAALVVVEALGSAYPCGK